MNVEQIIAARLREHGQEWTPEEVGTWLQHSAHLAEVDFDGLVGLTLEDDRMLQELVRCRVIYNRLLESYESLMASRKKRPS